MTREEAKQMFRDDKNSQGCYKAVLTKIDKIYDAFEEQMNKGQTLPIDSVIICSRNGCNNEKYKGSYSYCLECTYERKMSGY